MAEMRRLALCIGREGEKPLESAVAFELYMGLVEGTRHIADEPESYIIGRGFFFNCCSLDGKSS